MFACDNNYLLNHGISCLNSAIKTYSHHQLEIFGKGGEHDVKFWNAVIRQALIAHFLKKDIEKDFKINSLNKCTSAVVMQLWTPLRWLTGLKNLWT